jgi:O-antigen ligase
VTLRRFTAAPLVGVGPGNLDLTYVDHRGVPVRAHYTHDEYLQTAAETGVVGLGLVLAGASALAVGAVRRRHRSPRRAAAALAVLAAAAVHGAFDFLWHIAVLPLVLVLSVVTLLPPEESPCTSSPLSGAIPRRLRPPSPSPPPSA